MKRTLLVSALLVAALGCQNKRIQPARKIHEPVVQEPRPDLREQARDAWDEFARKGEYALERTNDGAIILYRETQKVAGQTADAISDAAIHTAVKTKLFADSNVSGNDVDVDVKDGVVTLRGHVDSASEAQTAARIALETRGVERVVSYLTF